MIKLVGVERKETLYLTKKQKTKAKKKNSDKGGVKATSMDELLDKTGHRINAPQKGDVVKGMVTQASNNLVLVDIGAKTEGMVIGKELDVAKDLIEDLSVGDEIEVYVKDPENDYGQILLSLRQAAEDRRWEKFTEWLETGQAIEVTGIETNKGGLIVSVDGRRGFVPSSQFSQEYLGKQEALVGKNFKVQVIEVDREQNRLIFSEKAVSEASEEAMKDEALKKVEKGDVLEGVVSGIMPFGVFATVSVPLAGKDEDEGRLEGLIHISEISWEKVDDPNKHFSVGNEVEVEVIGVDGDTGKLNLSIKRLKDDPWDDIKDKYTEGTKHTGKVVRMAPFGVFVNFEAGIDGLIHISKMPADREFEVGEEVDVYVEKLDVENRRMSLGVVLHEVPVGYK